MTEFAVSVEKNRWLKTKMEFLGVSEGDIEERFVHASGRGGQHVNKSSSCVYLKHTPTGLEVKCMEARSQSLNRFLARRYLLEKVEALAGGMTPKDAEAEKLKRQKARRKRRSGAKYAGPAAAVAVQETGGVQGADSVGTSTGEAGSADR
jgi:peptide chain release factor